MRGSAVVWPSSEYQWPLTLRCLEIRTWIFRWCTFVDIWSWLKCFYTVSMIFPDICCFGCGSCCTAVVSFCVLDNWKHQKGSFKKTFLVMIYFTLVSWPIKVYNIVYSTTFIKAELLVQQPPQFRRSMVFWYDGCSGCQFESCTDGWMRSHSLLSGNYWINHRKCWNGSIINTFLFPFMSAVLLRWESIGVSQESVVLLFDSERKFESVL